VLPTRARNSTSGPDYFQPLFSAHASDDKSIVGRRPPREGAASASFNTQLQACSLRRVLSQGTSTALPAERDACNPLRINSWGGLFRRRTISSPDRIRTFDPEVNSRLLTSGEGSLRRADRDPEPNRFEPTTRQSTARRSFWPAYPGRSFRQSRLCWLQSSTAAISRTCRKCSGPRSGAEEPRKRISSWMSGANCNRLTI
jgi:hypothetical protein